MDIYFNYDCDFEMVSLFERIMAISSRVSQSRGEKGYTGIFGTSIKADPGSAQLKTLRFRGIKVVCAIIASLKSWVFEKSWEQDRITAHEDHFAPNNAMLNPVVVGNRNPLLSVSMNHAVLLLVI